MTQKPDNPQAFPSVGRDGNWQPHCDGMTLRDYFAAAALQGENAAQNDVNFGICTEDSDFYNAAMRAYKFADAMLKAREATHD